MHLIAYYIATLVAYTSLSRGNSLSRIAKSNDQNTLLSQCRFFKTRRLRESCYRVGINSAVIKMEGKVISDIKSFKSYPTEPATMEEYTNGPNRSAIIKLAKWQRGANSSLGCRTYLHCDENIPLTTKIEHLRSASPWDYCNHYDSNRFPQWITEAVCLCKNCIDLETGWPTDNGMSRSISVSVSVIYKGKDVLSFEDCNNYNCYEDNLSVDVGCHCIRSVMRRRKSS